MSARRPTKAEKPEKPERPVKFGWGGRRKGAGRPPIPGRKRPAPHRALLDHKGIYPLHMSVRARAGLGSLRGKKQFEVVRECLRDSSSGFFRVLEFSVQADTVHMIVEARDKAALSKGARSLVIRTARTLNRVLDRRGPFWADRYRVRELTTPRAVRDALVLVLMNHKLQGPADRDPIDPLSSAPWFDGFREPLPPPAEPAITVPPQTWLGRLGWRRRGLIDPGEAPPPPK